MNAMMTPTELGHQIRDMAHKVQTQSGEYPSWVVCSHDIAPVVTDAVVAANLPITVHARDSLPAGQNFHMGVGEVPK